MCGFNPWLDPVSEPTMLSTDRLTLRPLSKDDAAAFVALAGDLAVARMTSDIPHPLDLTRALAWLAPAKGEVRFAIDHGGLMIGSAGYFSREPGVAETGFWLGRDWWGRGFATEAAGAVVHHAFTTGAIETLTSSHFVDNPASGRVLAKLGFEPTGLGRIWSQARGAEVVAVLLTLGRAKALAGKPQSPPAAAEGAPARSLWRGLIGRVKGVS